MKDRDRLWRGGRKVGKALKTGGGRKESTKGGMKKRGFGGTLQRTAMESLRQDYKAKEASGSPSLKNQLDPPERGVEIQGICRTA